MMSCQELAAKIYPIDFKGASQATERLSMAYLSTLLLS